MCLVSGGGLDAPIPGRDKGGGVVRVGHDGSPPSPYCVSGTFLIDMRALANRSGERNDCPEAASKQVGAQHLVLPVSLAR